jgi:hypothetical protein
MGSGDITLLPGGDIQAALDQAALVAGLVSNPVHSLPGSGPLPEVELVDPELERDMAGTMQALMEKMRSAAIRPGVRMTAAECFGELRSIRLVNSRGIDAQQEMTRWIRSSKAAEGRAGWRPSRRRRGAPDLEIDAAQIEQKSLPHAGTAGGGGLARQGPVVLERRGAGRFPGGDSSPHGVLGSLLRASKYAKISWEIGKSIFHDEVKGDPLTVGRRAASSHSGRARTASTRKGSPHSAWS